MASDWIAPISWVRLLRRAWLARTDAFTLSISRTAASNSASSSIRTCASVDREMSSHLAKTLPTRAFRRRSFSFAARTSWRSSLTTAYASNATGRTRAPAFANFPMLFAQRTACQGSNFQPASFPTLYTI